jgi:hypothetical protein
MAGKTELYRDYASWLTAAEPKFAFSRLDRAGFRRLLGGALALFLLSSLLLWQRMQVVKLGYEVSALSKNVEELRATHLRLSRRLQDIQSLPYAERVAREELGMGNIDPQKVVYLPDPSAALYNPKALWDRVWKFFSP